MFDPETVAFEVKYPWRCRGSVFFPKGYRRLFLTVWHRDPCRDGSDNSCGFTFPKLTPKQRQGLKGLAWVEAHSPWYQRLEAKSNDDPVEVEVLMRGAVRAVAGALGVRVSWGEVCDLACRLGPEFRSGLCHLPGYHTNFAEDRTEWREDTAYSLFSGIARHLLRERRPWYRHPRWHLHHWRLQVHPWQQLRHWYEGRRGPKAAAVSPG